MKKVAFAATGVLAANTAVNLGFLGGKKAMKESTEYMHGLALFAFAVLPVLVPAPVTLVHVVKGRMNRRDAL